MYFNSVIGKCRSVPQLSNRKIGLSHTTQQLVSEQISCKETCMCVNEVSLVLSLCWQLLYNDSPGPPLEPDIIKSIVLEP